MAILVVLVLIAVGVAFWRGGWPLTWLGLVQAGHLVGTVWFRLLLGFTLGGLIQVLVPRAVIAKWLGPASGIKGIIIGSYTAIIMVGGPYVLIPVVASLYVAGAGAGPIIALLIGHSLITLHTLIVWQVPFLGIGLPISKFIVGLIITPLAGFAGAAVFKLLTGLPDVTTKSDGNASTAGQHDGGEKASRAAEKGGKT